MRVLGVIPARLGSTRLPNKPLQLLAGEPLVTRVVQRVLAHDLVDQLVVATDSPWWSQVVERDRGGRRPDRRQPLDRDGAGGRGGRPQASIRDFDVIVNIQGDEPFLDREALAGALDAGGAGRRGRHRGRAARARARVKDPARVKVVTDLSGPGAVLLPRRRSRTAASRPTPPTGLYWQHLGIYAYTRAALDAVGRAAAHAGGTGGAAGAAPGAAERA